MTKLIDMTGRVFGKLAVLSRVASRGQAKWKCRCECGNITIQPGYELRDGNVISCGCNRRTAIGERSRSHGKTGTKEYYAWINMRNRCNNPDTRGYSRYGALGIKVCDRWKNSFENFFLDLGPRPDNYTLDRIDSIGNYSPDNCRWTDLKTQANNKIRIKKVTINGVTKSLSEWCDELNLSKRTIRARAYERGWDAKKAITTPIKKKPV